MRHPFLGDLWSRVLQAPENDEGSDYEEDVQEDADEGEDDAFSGDEDEVEEPADGGEDDDDGQDEGQEDRPSEVRPRSRGENRVAQATRAAAEAKREAAEAKAALEEIRRQTQARTQQETAAQRQARLDQMDPDQRTQYLLQEQRNDFQNQLNAIRFESQDSADRTAFEATCARNPVAAKHKDLVEQELQRLRSTGSTAPRETILNYVVGRAALAAAPRAKAKAERTAASSRSRQVARPASSRSDVGATGRRGSEAEQRRRRLEDIEI